MFQPHVVKGLWLSLMVLVVSVGISWGAQWSNDTNGWATVTSVEVQDNGTFRFWMEHPGQYANVFGNCSAFTPATPQLNDAVKMIHSVALSALVSGKRVSVLYDNGGPNMVCPFYRIMITTTP